MSNPYESSGPSSSPEAGSGASAGGSWPPYQSSSGSSSYPAQAYPPQQYPVAPMLPEHPSGSTVLILGILGFFVTVTAPFAWVMGSRALKEIRASGQHYANEQQLVIGRILGIVVTAIALAGLAFGLIFFIIVLAGVLGNAAY